MKKEKSSTNIWIWFIVLFALWQLFKFSVLRENGFIKKLFTPEKNKELIEENRKERMKELIDKIIKEKNLKKD